jgi:hypothetical protein
MTRIVRTTYRYKRPPRRRQAAALEVPAVVKADAPAKARKRVEEADQPLAMSGGSESAAATGRPVIVTIRSRKHAMLAHLLEDMTPEEHRRRSAADALFRKVTGKDCLEARDEGRADA